MVRFAFVQSQEGPEALPTGPYFAPDPTHIAYDGLRRAGVSIAPLPSEGVSAGTILAPRSTGPLYDLVHVVDRLLGPGGCPWDQAQTHESLKRHLLEEAYEVIEAIDDGSSEALQEELGDLLLQPVMHGQISGKNGGFTTDDAAQSIVDKLVRRHPHVFGDTRVADADEVLKNWDQIKRQEKGEEFRSILSGIPKAMPSLLRAYEVSKRAARAGFEWPDQEGVFDKLREEEAELREAIAIGQADRIAAELGDLLFTVVNLARWSKVEPEEALRQMLNRFTSRFEAMERRSPKPLNELSAEEWESLWQEAKAEESRLP